MSPRRYLFVAWAGANARCSEGPKGRTQAPTTGAVGHHFTACSLHRGRSVRRPLSITASGQGRTSGSPSRTPAPRSTPSGPNGIFEPFPVGDPLDGGAGLALAAIHAIVVPLLGSIEATGDPGHGITFTIHLPCAGGCGDEKAGTGRP
jgi:hypothetical protein